MQVESGEEKPLGYFACKGKTYTFCDKGEVEKFLKDPEAFIPAPVPRVAPACKLKTPKGGTFLLESLKGKLVLVDFWATWCGPCAKAMADIYKLYVRHSGNGFTFVDISIDDEGAKKVSPFIAKSKVKFTYPISLDRGDMWKQWGVQSSPSSMLVKVGQVLNDCSGAIDVKENYPADSLIRSIKKIDAKAFICASGCGVLTGIFCQCSSDCIDGKLVL